MPASIVRLPRRAAEIKARSSHRRRRLKHSQFPGIRQGLNDALLASLTDAAKFDRLAARLGASTPDAKANLRSGLRAKGNG